MRIVTCSASSIIGINNFGDELLTDVYSSWIRDCHPAIEVTHLAVNEYGRLTRRARQSIESAACLIFTGGGYFADGDHGSARQVRRHLRAMRNRMVYGSVFAYARQRNVPCAVFGLEVGPLANPLYRSCVKQILLSARAVVVRNEESRANAERICGGLVAPQVHLDAALSITRRSLSGEKDQESAAAGLQSQEAKVGLHVHSVDDDLDRSSSLEFITHIVSTLLRDRPIQLYYIHDQRKNGQHPSRSIRAEQLIVERFPGTRVLPYRGTAQMINEISAMDLLVTTKLHVGIVARGLDVPVIALGAHPKIRRFYEAIDEGDACWSPKASSNGIAGSIPSVINSERRGRRPLDTAFRESALGNRDAVRQLIESIMSGPRTVPAS